MKLVSVHFKTPENVVGWLVYLAELPRIGEMIVLRSHGGGDEVFHRGRVTDVRHLVFGSEAEHRAGDHQIEVDVDAS